MQKTEGAGVSPMAKIEGNVRAARLAELYAAYVPEAHDLGEDGRSAQRQTCPLTAPGADRRRAGSGPRTRRSTRPPAADLEHGGNYFGGYFEVVRGTSTHVGRVNARKQKLALTEQEVWGVGFRPSVGDINCNPGAREGLGLDRKRNYVAVSLCFRTEAHAREFVDAYERPVVGIARVKTMCLD